MMSPVVLPAPTHVPPRADEEPTDQVDFDWLVRWAKRRDPVRWALGAMVTVWSVMFIHLGFLRHNRFGTFGFDLGIYDQAVWLLSRFQDPFVTIRGLDFFGHHVNGSLVLFVPFYWLGAGPKFLLVAQVASQAAGAIAVYMIARDRLGTRWPAVALASVLLLHPTYQWLTWEYFHPDALALGPFLFAYWAARERRWRWFALAAVLAVACKEDVALAVIVLGLLIAARGDRRIGVIVAGLAAVWFAIATRVIIPVANGIGPFYDSFFGDFGSSAGEVARNVATDPGHALDVATRPDRMSYYRMMLAPVAFLALFAFPTFLIAAPMLGVNALSSFPYVREIRYHYSALVLAGIMVATIEAIARLGRTATIRTFLVGLVAATSLASTVAWGPSPLSVGYRSGIWPLTPDSRQGAKDRAVARIPARAPATVHYYFAPHMTHREKIYEWPAPWEPANWGVRGENLHDPAGVQWLLLDENLLNDTDRIRYEGLIAGEFTIRSQEQGIVVAERIRGPAGPPR